MDIREDSFDIKWMNTIFILLTARLFTFSVYSIWDLS